MLRLFAGYDEREAIGFHVFVASVLERATVPVSFHPLSASGLPQGSNAFTFSRFLVPWLMQFNGRAIFCDACDMLMLEDIAELDALYDSAYAVQVVHRPVYKTRHPLKYIGTSMQCPNRDYERKNWASVMMINCGHEAWRPMTPDFVCAQVPLKLLQLRFIDDADIGYLPERWNRIVDEAGPIDGAALLHYTAGLPCFPHYRNTPGADLWRAQYESMIEVP